MTISKEAFADLARERFREAEEFLHNWRVCARDDYAFVCGDQWMAADAEHLKAERRPPITFNYSEKMIDAVVGAEVNNRQEAIYKPRGVEDSGAADIWNAAAKWAREECAAEDEESDSFRDMLICGLGWTQTRISYDDDQDGKLLIDRIDPLEMWYDPASSKVGLSERRYNFRKWWVDEREAKREWPSANFLSSNDADNTSTGVTRHGQGYNENEPEDDRNRHRGQVQLRMYECVEREPIYRVALNNGLQEMSVADFNDMRDVLDETGIQYVKQYRKVYYRGFFSGEDLLRFEKSPCQDGFVFQPITGKRDRNKNVWYGLTRVMKDPQRWANKWLSQILHIINSNAKGGLMAEINAFADPKKAQEEWAQPDSITLFNEGALSGSKVVQKQATAFPAGLDKLMQFALGSLPMVTGINLEALGLANREQAGVLEAQRKQAAYGLLAPLFDAFRRYRKSQGRVLLFMIHTYISDGRLIRIGGPDSQEFLPLAKAEGGLRYDIIVDQSPTAPDVKQQTWESLMQLVPSLMKAGIQPPIDLLEYSPLPAALVTKWKKFAQENPPPDPRMQQMQQEMQKLTEENQALKQDASIEQAQLKQKADQIEVELMIKNKTAEAEIDLKRRLAIADFELRQLELDQDLQLERQKAAVQLQIAKEKAENDREIALIAARNKPTPTKD